MFCENCGKEIGKDVECKFCGYDPVRDKSGRTGEIGVAASGVAPVEVVDKPISNKMAVSGFVLSFFSLVPICGILSFIFSLIGFFRAKNYRSGRVRAVFGIIFSLIAALLYVMYFVFLYGQLTQSDPSAFMFI